MISGNGVVGVGGVGVVGVVGVLVLVLLVLLVLLVDLTFQWVTTKQTKPVKEWSILYCFFSVFCVFYVFCVFVGESSQIEGVLSTILGKKTKK